MNIKLKKAICSVMPFWIERLYINNRYDLSRFSVFKKILLMILPSLFVYIVSNHNHNDKRPVKYWLPYGLMRDRMLKNYGKQIETGYHSKPARLLRWFLPYGYVLWWDKSNSYGPAVMAPQNTVSTTGVDSKALSRINEQLSSFKTTFTNNQMKQLELTERIEVALLKLAIEVKNQSLMLKDEHPDKS